MTDVVPPGAGGTQPAPPLVPPLVPPPPARLRRRRPFRTVLLALAATVLAYVAATALGMPPSLPFDVVVNVGSVPVDGRLRAPPGRTRLVVLQHGLWRSAYAMGRYERALADHGYEVLNHGYASTSARIEEHADALFAAVAAKVAELSARDGNAPEVAFVGHSMGGLVIHEYLRRPNAVRPWACVHVATPHRGAMLTDLRKRWWLFGLVMGSRAAVQLSPGDPFHLRPLSLQCPAGTIVGDLGEGNEVIPGPDDGTVAVGEARLPGEADSITLPLGHTRLGFADEPILQTLAFLKNGRFRNAAR